MPLGSFVLPKSGPAYTPLTKGAQVAGQNLSAGTTSSNPVTFNSPSGGSGSYSYSATVANIAGSGATLSGSGLGPYIINNLSDGDSAVILLTITDNITGETETDMTGASVLDTDIVNLISGGAPSSQALASGTTTSSPFTFNAPSGDTYTATYTLQQTVGSGVALSGSGLGPYTLTNLEDGDVCLVVAEFTGDTDGDVVRDVFLCSVAKSVTPQLTLGAGLSDQALSSGNTSSSSFTFNAPSGDTYTSLVTINQVVGAGASLTGTNTGLGPFTVDNLEDGDVVEVTITFTPDGGGVVQTQTFVISVAVAAVVTDIIDFGTVDYDFLTTGGTSGTGGEGSHTVNGISVNLSYNGGSAPAQLEFIGGVLTWDCNTSATEFVLVCDAGSSMQGKILSAYSKLDLTAMDGATSAFIMSMKENAAVATNVAGNMDNIAGLSGVATTNRFRGVVSGSTFDNFDTTVSNITTNSLRQHIFVHHNGGVGSVDSSSSDLPDYGALGTTQTQTWNQGNRKQTFSDYRYLHLRGVQSDGQGVFKLVDIPAYE